MDSYNAITFFDAYVEAALWSSSDESRPDGGDPLDQNHVPADLAPETREKMRVDCQKFQAENEDLLNLLYAEMPVKAWLGEAQAGHDFWLSRNGHGAGFFDREASKEVCNALQEKAQAYGNFDLYIGDDGQIWGQ
jgi:hypothetical protein